MRYLPQTNAEIRQMLDAIGVASVDELFAPLPEQAHFKGQLNVPAALSEPKLMATLNELAQQSTGPRLLSFLGAGIYSHHIPPAVDQLLLRSEFYTAYTPYQPEVAQGTLQAIWEFQTIVSEILGLPLANASMYDGATAAAEAAQMARRLSKRAHVIVSSCVHPEYRRVIQTYLAGQSADAYTEIAAGADGCHDEQAILAACNDTTAACVVGYPSFTGGLRDVSSLAAALHKRGTLLATSTTEPYALGVAQSPGAMGVDIATGEGQAIACSPNFGGPGVGLFACRHERKYLQQMPGRICGETVDANGQRGFVLTLSTREQHIRRERATSNICTNQGLLALSFTIRSCMLGKVGFVETAKACLSKAAYLRTAISRLSKFELTFGGATVFNEFAVAVPGGDAGALIRALEADGILAGLDLGRFEPAWRGRLLIAVTESHTRAELDRLVEALSRFRP